MRGELDSERAAEYAGQLEKMIEASKNYDHETNGTEITEQFSNTVITEIYTKVLESWEVANRSNNEKLNDIPNDFEEKARLIDEATKNEKYIKDLLKSVVGTGGTREGEAERGGEEAEKGGGEAEKGGEEAEKGGGGIKGVGFTDMRKDIDEGLSVGFPEMEEEAPLDLKPEGISSFKSVSGSRTDTLRALFKELYDMLKIYGDDEPWSQVRNHVNALENTIFTRAFFEYETGRMFCEKIVEILTGILKYEHDFEKRIEVLQAEAERVGKEVVPDRAGDFMKNVMGT